MGPEKDDTIERLKAEIRKMQLCLERKNRMLDALNYVWCDGGCQNGTHRWTKNNITEEIVNLAEKNTVRLRMWFENNKLKDNSQ